MLWILHIAAIFIYPLALFVTIPVHIFISAFSGSRAGEERPTPQTHVRCPDCKELVRKDANVCKHCRCRLTPQA